ncbi:MAG TPA: hypothetical protein VMS65_15560 [Polyangiaceae bacterium]|nr:hypothetical protein [Polyangiaceae bacterium]
MSLVRRLLLASAMSACACAPLTYSEDGAVDFGKYSSVRVSVASSLDPVGATSYLADELRAVSGFVHVTVDATKPVDAVLEVWVSTLPETQMNDDGTLDSYYSSEANYRLSSPDDPGIDTGNTTDQSEYEWEAIEDVLDQVALHYIRPYRL